MITYFHHINDGKRDRSKKLFHHRWFWHTKKREYNLEICSGRDLAFEFQRGEAGDNENSCMLRLGLLFFSIYFIFPVPSKFLEHKKCIATWDNNREFYLVQGRKYGFYFFEWAFVWSWHKKVNESSSSEPWWMSQYVHIDELFLGKKLAIRNNVGFEQKDIYFKLGDQEFKIDSIKWEKAEWFRSFIPFSIYSHRTYTVNIEIEKPPMRSGKGENSWDCDDDGTYGLYCCWDKSLPIPTWQNTEECLELAVNMYVKGVLKDARRYGTTDKENRGFNLEDVYTYIGIKKEDKNESE